MKESLDSIVNSRKEYANERRLMKIKEMEGRTVDELRKAATEERRVAAEERLALAKDSKMTVEERKVVSEEWKTTSEQDQIIIFVDTSGFNEMQKAYVEILHDHVSAIKTMSMGFMGGFIWEESWEKDSWVAAWEPWEEPWLASRAT